MSDEHSAFIIGRNGFGFQLPPPQVKMPEPDNRLVVVDPFHYGVIHSKRLPVSLFMPRAKKLPNRERVGVCKVQGGWRLIYRGHVIGKWAKRKPFLWRSKAGARWCAEQINANQQRELDTRAYS